MRRNKVAVVLWLYHTDLANEFIDLLAPHQKYIDIFLGLCHDNANTEAESLFKYVFKDNLYIEYLPNGGTDILPTLKLLEKCIDHYPIFFKLHSKYSPWGALKQVNWRVILLNDILYKNNFSTTIKNLQTSSVGIVASKPFIMKNHEYTNSQNILELCSMLNIDYTKLNTKSFIGGNIFAAKTTLFKPLLYNNAVYHKLSQEVGAIKDDDGGKYVHSMERIFGYMAEYHNKKIIGAPYHSNIILSPNLKKHRLHLIKLYNKDCYIQENPNVYGSIISLDNSHMTIQWKNTDQYQIQSYKKHIKYFVNVKYYADT
jgi:lipopolysaccharide biosynthesis protein